MKAPDPVSPDPTSPDPSSAGITIRPYRPADRDACLQLFDSNVPGSFDIDERREFIAYLDDLPGPYLVLTDGAGRIQACGGWASEPGTRRVDLCWGMVRRSRHRAGWGRALTLARLEGVADMPAVDRVQLQTSQDTEGFYERLGFTVVEREIDGFRPGFDRVVMQKDLRG